MKIFFLLFSMLTIFTCQFSIFTFKITCILQEVLKKVKTFSLRQNKTFSKIRHFLQLSELQGSGAILILIFIKPLSRSSHQMRSLRKGALRNFTKFTGKHLWHSLFFNKVAALAQVFSCEFCEISKNTFFTEHLWTTASVCLAML